MGGATGGRLRRLYPQKGRLLLDGGMDNKFERTIILDNESPDCQNVRFTNGAVETRQGTAKLNTTAIGSFVGDGLYTRRTDAGVETMVAFAGGTAWTLAGTTFTAIASGTSVFTAGVRVGATQYENHLFIGNGGVIPYKYNGTAFTRHGVYPPTTGPVTNDSFTTGSILASNVTYTYKVTYVNSQSVQGDLSVAGSGMVTTGGTGILLTSIPVAPQSWGVNSRMIYRASGATNAYFRVGTISDNTTTTFNDTTTIASATVAAPSDNGVPPMYNVIAYHQNRLFCNDTANPNYLVYSELGEPYTFPAVNFIKVGDAASDLIKAIGVHNNSIIVYCENSATLIYMPDTDDANWVQVKINTPFGCKSPYAIANFENKQFFGAFDGKFLGFAALAGNAVDPNVSLLTIMGAAGDFISEVIEPDMEAINESYIHQMSAISYRKRIYVAVPYGSSQTTNNRVYVMDFSHSNVKKPQKLVWSPDTGINAAQFTIYNGKLYYISSTATGFVYEYEKNGVYNDDGGAIDSYFWTKEFSGYEDEYVYHKDWRYCRIMVSLPGDWDMNFSYRLDSDSGDGITKQIDLNPGGSLWGSLVWGLDLWGGGSDTAEKQVFLGPSASKRIQFKFDNQNVANQRFKVLGINMAYNIKGFREGE